METDVLALSAVSKWYRGSRTPVLENVELALVAGSLVQVHGGNGSGKSTLLRLAAGFARPTAGTVRRSHSSLGFLPDSGAPAGRFTGRAYLRELGRIRGLAPSSIRSRIEELDSLFAVAPGLDGAVPALSKGNRQKIAIMQAFLAPADLLVMDEPATALDDGAIAALRAEIGRALAAGASILVATHGDGLAGLGATLVLERGRLSSAGGGRTPATSAVTIRLTGPRPALELVARAAAIPAAMQGSAAQFAVDRSRVSEVLRAALDAGCDVTHVGPAS